MIAPSAALPLRDLILGALAEAVLLRRYSTGFCKDCERAADGLCQEHRDDSALADDYEAAYMRVRGIGSDGAALALARGLVP